MKTSLETEKVDGMLVKCTICGEEAYMFGFSEDDKLNECSVGDIFPLFRGCSWGHMCDPVSAEFEILELNPDWPKEVEE